MVTVVALYCKNVKLQLHNTDSVVDYVLQLKEIGSRNYSFYLVLSQAVTSSTLYKFLPAESLSDFVVVSAFIYTCGNVCMFR